MGYIPIHDKIDFANKGQDFNQSDLINESAFGVICDGVSSSVDAGLGAQFACQLVMQELREGSLDTNINFNYQNIYVGI